MSYILDALKKMEQEKNLKAAPKEKINLSGALLKDDMRPGGKNKTGRKLVGVVLIALVAVSGIAWYFLGKTPKVAVTVAPQQQAVNPLPTPQPQQNQAVPSPPPQPTPVPEAANVPPAQAVSPAPQEARPSPPASPGASSLPPAAPVAVKRPAAVPVSSEESDEEEARPKRRNRGSRSIGAPSAQVTQTATSAASVAPTVAAPANIKVSGIAWQDTRSARRAVINDLLMKEGNEVSGAKIIEIKQDRVRFSLSGGTFEVPLLSSATAAPGAAK